MIYNTKLSCGDTAWIYYGHYQEGPQTATVAKIIVEEVKYVNRDPDDYQAKEGYTEKYMCLETGVGSGTVHTFGEHIFLTKEDCVAAYAERIKEVTKAEAEWVAREKRDKLAREDYLRSQLAEIEQIKAESIV